MRNEEYTPHHPQAAADVKHSSRNISVIAIMDHKRDSSGAYHQLAEYGTENPPSAGFLFFKSLGYSMEQAPWSTEVVPTLSLQATDEGLGSSPASTPRC